MTFTRFVEVGRVALINYGPLNGKLAVITEIADQSFVQVHGPGELGVPRQLINVRRLSLTDFKLTIGRGSRAKALKKAIEKEDLLARWAATSWAKRIAVRARRARMNDFERFKLRLVRAKKARLVAEKLAASA